jgi:hypothetical protein
VARKERNESENRLLARYTEQRERILEEASHLAARKLGLDDKAYPDDPIFRNIDRASKAGKKKTRWSVDHDKILYRKP